MIKHGPIQKLERKGQGFNFTSHLEPIKEFVTRGIADAKEKIILQPQACDVRGAKKFDGQQCVIAKALKRTMKPQAVAVGRSLAYVVMDGLAIRFRMPTGAQKVVEEFDSRGRVRNAPIELSTIFKSWKLQAKRRQLSRANGKTHKRRTKKLQVRAIGGGVTR